MNLKPGDMKTKNLFHLLVCLLTGFSSCTKENDTPAYDSSKMSIEVFEVLSTKALIVFNAEEVSELGEFTFGICYSENPDPTFMDSHYEMTVNSDTLGVTYVFWPYLIENLYKSTNYNIRGYIKKGQDVFYSAKQSFKTPASSLLLDVSYKYIPSGWQYWVTLSVNGTTMVTQEISNDEIYLLTDNVPDVADLTIFKWNPADMQLLAETYTNVVPDEIYLDNPYYNYPAGTVTVTVSDLSSFLSWGIASSWWWSTATSPDVKTLSTSLSGYSDDLFLHYIPDDGSAPRYKIVDDATAGAEYSYTMSDFTPMTSFVNIDVPANVFFTYTLAGFNTDYYSEFKKFHGYSYTSGYPGTFKLYYPAGVNSNYYIYTYYNTDNTQSFYNKIGTMPATFFTEFPNISINNPGKFITTTSSIDDYAKYDMIDFCGYYITWNLNIRWDYYKRPEANNSIILPDLPAALLSETGNFSTGDLLFSDVGYLDFINSQVSDYDSYVDLLVKKSLRFYDVVKERRYYFKWVNDTKSSGYRDIRDDMRLPDDI